jgi:CDP-archaeol synthase
VISIFDQADWVPVAWILLRPVYKLRATEAIEVFVLVAAVHVAINLIGYTLGVRAAPL